MSYIEILTQQLPHAPWSRISLVDQLQLDHSSLESNEVGS